MNDELKINHNWGAIGKPGEDWMKAMHREEDADKTFIKTEPLSFDGGSRYLLKMEVYHTVYNRH